MAVLQILKQLFQELHLFVLFNPFLVSLLLIIPLLLLFTHLKTLSGRKIEHLPPSPPKLPILGHLHLLGTHPHRSLRALSDVYGPMMMLHIGRIPTLVVSSAKVVKEIATINDAVFSNRPKTMAADILLYGCKDVGFAPYGEYWKKARKICVVELLSPTRVRQMRFVREEETASLVERIQKACETSGEASCSINLSELLISTTNNVVTRCAIGQTFGEDDDWSSLGGLSRLVLAQLMALSVGDLYPGLGWVDHLRGFIGRLKSIFRALDQCLHLMFEERKEILENNGEKISEMKNFVDILLQFEKDAMLSRDEIKGILLDVFMGGTTTTSGTLEWMMTELLRNPRVMRKAQEEVRSVVGKKQKIDVNDINQMGYLKCVVKETLRLHPAAPLLAPRETTKSIELEGYRIPSKTRVLINAWAIQRHPSSWEWPEDFFPERFQNNSTSYEDEDFNFVPFGFGRRACPGLKFAIASIEYVAANLLYWFDWKLSVDVGACHEMIDMTEVYGLSVHKKVPLHLIPIPYSPWY